MKNTRRNLKMKLRSNFGGAEYWGPTAALSKCKLRSFKRLDEAANSLVYLEQRTTGKVSSQGGVSRFPGRKTQLLINHLHENS